MFVMNVSVNVNLLCHLKVFIRRGSGLEKSGGSRLHMNILLLIFYLVTTFIFNDTPSDYINPLHGFPHVTFSLSWFPGP